MLTRSYKRKISANNILIFQFFNDILFVENVDLPNETDDHKQEHDVKNDKIDNHSFVFEKFLEIVFIFLELWN